MATQTDPIPEPEVVRVLVPVPTSEPDPMEVAINEAVEEAATGTPLKEPKRKQAQLADFFEAPEGYKAPEVAKKPKPAKKLRFALMPDPPKAPKPKKEKKEKGKKGKKKRSKYALGERVRPKTPTPEPPIDLLSDEVMEEATQPVDLWTDTSPPSSPLLVRPRMRRAEVDAAAIFAHNTCYNGLASEAYDASN